MIVTCSTDSARPEQMNDNESVEQTEDSRDAGLSEIDENIEIDENNTEEAQTLIRENFENEENEDEVIVITGTLRETRIAEAPVHTTIISDEQIQEMGATNVAEALENEPGVVLRSSHGGTGSILTMQGLDSRYVLVLVNGNPVPGRIRNELNLEELGVNNVDRIEIIKGPSSSLYGSEAVGGVINIITNNPENRFAQQDLEYSFDVETLYGRNNLASVSFVHDLYVPGFWYTIGGNFRHIDPYHFYEDSRIADADGQQTFSANFRAGLIPGMDYEIILFGNYFYGEYDHNKVLNNPLASDFALKSRNRRALAGIEATYYSMDAGIFQFSLSYNFFDHLYDKRKFESETNNLQITTENTYSIEGKWQKDLWGFNYFSLLIGHNGNFLESERVDGLKDRYNGFLALQDEMSFFNDRFILVPGLRIDYNSAYDWAISPKLSLMYKIIEDLLTFRASGGRAFKAPTFKDLYIDMTMPGSSTRVYGNPDLKPEYSWGVNTGFDILYDSIFNFNINGFYNYIENQIAALLLPDSESEYQYQNYDKGYTTGLETTFGLFIIPYTKILLGYTYTYARYFDSKDQVHKDAYLVPHHKATFRLIFETKDLISIDWLNIKSTFWGEYIGNQYKEGETEEYETVDDFVNLHFNLEITLFENYSIFAGLDNILNHKEVIPYLSGISAYGGIRAHF